MKFQIFCPPSTFAFSADSKKGLLPTRFVILFRHKDHLWSISLYFNFLHLPSALSLFSSHFFLLKPSFFCRRPPSPLVQLPWEFWLCRCNLHGSSVYRYSFLLEHFVVSRDIHLGFRHMPWQFKPTDNAPNYASWCRPTNIPVCLFLGARRGLLLTNSNSDN